MGISKDSESQLLIQTILNALASVYCACSCYNTDIKAILEARLIICCMISEDQQAYSITGSADPYQSAAPRQPNYPHQSNIPSLTVSQPHSRNPPALYRENFRHQRAPPLIAQQTCSLSAILISYTYSALYEDLSILMICMKSKESFQSVTQQSSRVTVEVKQSWFAAYASLQVAGLHLC
ncbi:hypothetical protein FGO68_gene2216 [Halteria grandinella]|uniref:Uncharacterized protein n=1 Tax=Halteria grandinella TaxID=5974 RepID=A0A8J8NYU8_HALGN|nr:hypothetical protein FGO68_gene2216 [Halteria grandinella]